MVYQEDVLKIAHHFGGLDLSDADVLRRMMSGKSRNQKQFEEIEKKFFKYCEKQKYPEGLGLKVWKQIESFAGYSFAKGHSASYAGESYQSLYLKTHYPFYFIAASMNLDLANTDKLNEFYEELKRLKIDVVLPSINESFADFVVRDNKVYYALAAIKAVGYESVNQIISDRKNNGIFKSLYRGTISSICLSAITIPAAWVAIFL